VICNSWSAIEKTVLLFLEARIVGCDAEGAVVLNIEHWPRRARCSQFLVAINLASSNSLVRRACSKLTRRVRIPPLNRIDCTALHRVNGKSSSVSQSTTDELHRCSSNGGIIRYRPQLRVRRRAGASLFHCKTCLPSAETREPTGHARRATIRRLLAIPRSADLFHFCRLHLSTRASVGSCRVERYTSGQHQSVFLSLNVPNGG